MKKTTSVAVHMAESRRLQIKRYAEHKGLSESEFVHGLIESHFKELEHEARLVLSFLADQSSMSSDSSDNTGEPV